MNIVMKTNRGGIGYMINKEKKTPQYKPRPKPKRCFECGQGHFTHECETPPPTPLPKHAISFAFNAHYIKGY
jgi:hypothetical protein